MQKITAIILSIYLIMALAWFKGYRICLNKSHSLPNTVYLAAPISNIAIGKIVSFKLPHSKATFCKVISGIPGDSIRFEDRKIYVNDIQKGERGVETKLSYISEGIIPDGYLFVLGCTSDSFDSRYSIFGLVPITAIQEQLWPIF